MKVDLDLIERLNLETLQKIEILAKYNILDAYSAKNLIGFIVEQEANATRK